MDLRVDIVISASLLLVMVKPDPKSPACTRFLDVNSPCGCTLSQDMFEPVCGSDGASYLSACFLECRKVIDKIDISVYHKGACTKDSLCTCPSEYDPKCGSNNVTYSNECVLQCFIKKDRNIRFKHDGECRNLGEQRLYGAPAQGNYQPGICRCSSKAKSHYSQHGGNGNGHAQSTCGCPRKKKLQQVVQPEIQTVQSPCNAHQMQSSPKEIDAQKLNLHAGDKCVCAAIHAPVCDYNHKTYANFCVLHCTAQKKPSIKLLHWGDCRNTL